VFTHIILTRFNCRFSAKWTSVALDEDWLSHRFKLFDDYCYPSVSSQDCKNFFWLLFYDQNTPQKYVNKIKSYKNENYIFVAVDVLTSEVVLKEINKLISKGSKYLITTRLDNDDAISTDFVRLIQENFIEKDKMYINLDNGLIMKNGKIYSHKDIHNAFVSFVEKVSEKIECVWSVQHTEIHKRDPVLNIFSSPAWLQIIHERNVTNKVHGRLVSVNNFFEKFKTSHIVELNKINSFDIFIDHFFKFPFRLLRDYFGDITRPIRIKFNI
jgi:hypothetical protein